MKNVLRGTMSLYTTGKNSGYLQTRAFQTQVPSMANV